MTYLNSCLQRQESVAGVAHLEDASKPVLGDVPYLEDFEFWRHGAKVELGNEDVIDDDRRLRGLVQRRCQEVAGFFVELLVGRQRRPVEVEGHVELAGLLRVSSHQRENNGLFDKP